LPGKYRIEQVKLLDGSTEVHVISERNTPHGVLDTDLYALSPVEADQWRLIQTTTQARPGMTLAQTKVQMQNEFMLHLQNKTHLGIPGNHEMWVKTAVENGWMVPENVLVTYPKLMKIATTKGVVEVPRPAPITRDETTGRGEARRRFAQR
jgi:hypothetical protein